MAVLTSTFYLEQYKIRKLDALIQKNLKKTMFLNSFSLLYLKVFLKFSINKLSTIVSDIFKCHYFFMWKLQKSRQRRLSFAICSLPFQVEDVQFARKWKIKKNFFVLFRSCILHVDNLLSTENLKNL